MTDERDERGGPGFPTVTRLVMVLDWLERDISALGYDGREMTPDQLATRATRLTDHADKLDKIADELGDQVVRGHAKELRKYAGEVGYLSAAMEHEAEKTVGLATSLEIGVSDLRDHARTLTGDWPTQIIEMVREAAPHLDGLAKDALVRDITAAIE
jgi:hypothetical protein